jgi:hypothetical protein
MNDNATFSPVDPGDVPRLFLRELGWTFATKQGTEREYCYAMLPGQDFYHRLMDGELYLQGTEERLCIPCAARRGLIDFTPKVLRDPVRGLDVERATGLEPYDVAE